MYKCNKLPSNYIYSFQFSHKRKGLENVKLKKKIKSATNEAFSIYFQCSFTILLKKFLMKLMIKLFSHINASKYFILSNLYCTDISDSIDTHVTM